MLNALDDYLHPGIIIILRGDKVAMKDWQQAVFKHYLPEIVCYAIPVDVQLPSELADKQAPDKGVCAYICEGFSCREPVTDFNNFTDSVINIVNRFH